MKREVIACAVILVISLFIGGVMAETYTATGGNGNGEYAATLYVDENGNMALALAGVVQGTLDPVTPATPPQASFGIPGPVVTPVISQDYTINAQDGQGFAGCSVVGSNGNQAATSLSVESGQATVHQEAGVAEISHDESITRIEAYAEQTVDEGSYGDNIAAFTYAKTLIGNSASVQAQASGMMNVLQRAGAYQGIWDLGDDDVLNLDNAYATQAGVLGPGMVNNGFAGATGLDSQGNVARVGSNVEDGTLIFNQDASVGDTIFTEYTTYSYAWAWQNASITGMYGKTYGESFNAGDVNHTCSKVEFDNRNPVTSGMLNFPTPSGPGTINVTSGAQSGSDRYISFPAGSIPLEGPVAMSGATELYLGGDLQNYRAEGYGRNLTFSSTVTSLDFSTLKQIDSVVHEDGVEVTIT
jgi:hypothetical protein